MVKDFSKVIIGTGSYDNVKSGNTVSITGDGGNAWGYFGPSYKKLAPKLVTYIPYSEKYSELLKMENNPDYVRRREEIENEYIESYYETRLKNLCITDLFATLYEKFGDNIILLCHERVDEFCHRRLVADYIELETGIYIPEVSIFSNKIIELEPIRYTKRLEKVMRK